MGSLTNFAETEIMDHVFNGASNAYTTPGTVYLALFTADPTETGSVAAEVGAGVNYIRKAITFGAVGTPARGITQNAQVTFDQASGSWGTITHWGIMTLASGGSMIAYGQFTTSKSVVSGNTPSVASGEIVITCTAGVGMSDYLAGKILDHLFRNTAYTQPATYIALVTVNPTDSSTGANITEPSGNNYARKLVNAAGGAAPKWSLAAAASNGLVQNADAITLNTPSGSWGLITGMCIVDSGTLAAGNVLFYEDTVVDQTPDNGDTVQIAANAFQVTLD